MKPRYSFNPKASDRLTLLAQFYGAVKTRIEDRQKALWSRFIGAGFTSFDIEEIWPEGNMRFFTMRYSGHTQSFQLRDLNLRELDEIAKWIRGQPGTGSWASVEFANETKTPPLLHPEDLRE